MSNLFADGFETTLAAWSSYIEDTGDLSVSTAAKIHGAKGLSCLIDDVNAIYVQDNTPSNETRYRLRFYFDPNSISMPDDTSFCIFAALNTAESTVFKVYLERHWSGVYKIWMYAREDDGSNRTSDSYIISDGVHYIELDFQASSAPAADDGFLTLYIDDPDTEKTILAALDNDTKSVDFALLGPSDGTPDANIAGTIFFDDFASNDDGSEIGMYIQQANFAGTLSMSGSLSRNPKKVLTGILNTSGSLIKNPKKILTGILNTAGSLNKKVGKTFLGSLMFQKKWPGLGIGMYSTTGNNWVLSPLFSGFVDDILGSGFKEIRIDLVNWNDSGVVDLSKSAVVIAVGKGANVIWGLSSAVELTSTNWPDYVEAVEAAALWAQTNGVFEFQLGNELEGMIDGTTLTLGTLITNLKTLATSVQAIFTNGNVSYSCLPDNISDWVTAGKGNIDLLASNVYMAWGEENTPIDWEGFIDALIAGFGVNGTYLTEFGPQVHSLLYYSEDESVQAAAVKEMLDYIIASGMQRAIFFTYYDDPLPFGPQNFGARKTDMTYRLLWNEISVPRRFAGSIFKTVSIILEGTLVFSGSLVKKAGHVLDGTLQFAGSLTKKASHILTGTLQFAGNLVKKVSHVLFGSLQFIGIINRIYKITLEGNLRFSGSLTGVPFRKFPKYLEQLIIKMRNKL